MAAYFHESQGSRNNDTDSMLQTELCSAISRGNDPQNPGNRGHMYLSASPELH